jgi:broad specificity phosphatase PhoE
VVPAENQVMNLTDPPLNRAGLDRAKVLRDSLADKHIGYIFSTNYDRTKSTALPLSELTGVEIKTYAGMPDQAFMDQLKSADKNVLIVGHSNTVDDIVNALVGEKVLNDLGDSEYNNLFVVTKTDGK